MPSKRSYDLAFKQIAVDLAKMKGNRPAAAQLHVDEKRIRERRQQEAAGKFSDLDASIGACKASKRQRLPGGGRKVNNEEMEIKIRQWILDERSLYHRVTRKSICSKAIALANDPNFKASRGWVEKFMERHNFVLRSKTTTGQRLPPELAKKVVAFVCYCKEQQCQHLLRPENISNMDETTIWADIPGDATLDIRGVQHVPMLTTGHEKSRITVCLSAMADGRKLPPFVVFKEKRMPTELVGIRSVIIELSDNGWMKPYNTMT